MALNQKQKDWLDTWSKTQAGFSNGQVDGNPANDLKLGTMLDNGAVTSDVLRDELAYTNFTLPAPSGAAVTLDVPIVVAPGNGSIVSASLLVPAGISNTSTTASSYNFSVYRLNNTATALCLAVPTLTGITSSANANVLLRLPTGSSNQLLTATANYSITVNGLALNLNCATVTATWVTQPNVGDWLNIGAANVTQFVGANAANEGLYLITSATATSLTATKQTALTAPVNVASAAAIAGDATGLRLIKAQESTFSTGDQLAVRVSVPAASTAVTVTTQYQVQLRLRYSF